MGLNCFLHLWSALGTLSLVWLTKISSAFSSLRGFDFLQQNFFFLCEEVGNNGWAGSGTMGGQWTGNDLGFDWERVG